MKKQVNIYIEEEDYTLLMKEIANRMITKGQNISMSSLMYELMKPAISKLNGQTPSEDNIQETKQIDEPIDSKQSKLAEDFAKIDF